MRFYNLTHDQDNSLLQELVYIVIRVGNGSGYVTQKTGWSGDHPTARNLANKGSKSKIVHHNISLAPEKKI